jgi:hypothetical protein
MKRNPLVFVFDIEAAIEGIIEATNGKTFDEFRANWLLRHAVQRGIEIISEAARHMPQEALARHPEIPWPKVRGRQCPASRISKHLRRHHLECRQGRSSPPASRDDPHPFRA